MIDEIELEELKIFGIYFIIFIGGILLGYILTLK